MAFSTFAVLLALVFMPLPIIAKPVNEWCASINNYVLYELFKGLQSPINEPDNLTSILEFICMENDVDMPQLLVKPLLKTLQSKAKHMLSKAKPKRSAGGKSRDLLLTKWRTSSYKLRLTFRSPGALKSKLERDLQTQISLRLEAEKELQSHKNKRKNKNGVFLQPNASKRTQRRHRLKGFKQILQALPLFGSDGDEPVRTSIETKGKKMINIMVTGKGTLNISDKKALYLKDRYGISDKTYHELALSSAKFPKLRSVKLYANQLNASYNIQELPGGIGVFQSLRERLTTRINKLTNNNPMTDSVIKVKLFGDGTCLGKRIHVVNIVFSVMNEANCKSVTGNHILSILKVREKYQSLKDALNPILCEVSEMQTIVINGRVFDIVFFLGGDLKFLNVMTGLDACSSTYSCLWCHCSKSDRWDHRKQWSMINQASGARTIESITQYARQKKNKYKLFKSAPFYLNTYNTHCSRHIASLFENL